MPLIVKDRVRETTTTTGTGTLTLIAPVTGFQSFSVIGNGNTTYYSIVDVATGAWEVGIGTYTSSGTTLSRDTVLESSTGGAKVSFSSGTKDVFCTYPAERSVSQADVGTDPNEIPLNQYLGSMAYQDRLAVNIGGGVATLSSATVTTIQNDTAISNVEPSLMLNFAAVEALDPRITYTRASTATYYNGVTTAVAEQNLLLQSQTFETTWATAGSTVTANTTTAPDGTTTADSLIPLATTGTHRVLQSTTGVGAFAFSVFVKANGYSKVGIWDSVTTGAYAAFDLSTGTVLNSGAGASSATITALTNSWYRISFVATMSGSIGFAIQVLDPAYTTGGINVAWLADGTSGVFIWGAQLEQRSAVSAYTPTTTQPITNYIPVLLTAASGVPRFDHNPISGDSLGFLVEQQSTNLATQSQTFTTWTKSATTVTNNVAVAPDGTLTSSSLVPTATSTGHSMYLAGALGSGSFTFSVYAKAGGFPRLGMRVYDGTVYQIRVTFDISTGTIVSNTAGTATITPVGNGWYRCTCTGTSASGNMGAVAGWTIESLPAANIVQDSFLGDGYSGAYVWGAQIEATAFSTSYIATVASQVTRAADAASMTGTNFSSWFNNAEGTVYCEATPAKLDANTSPLWTMGTTNTNFINCYASTARALYISVNGVNVVDLSPGTSINVFRAGVQSKVASAYKTNDCAAVVTGSSVATDTSNTLPIVTKLGIGQTQTADNFYCGTIAKLAYYPRRLSNEELQEMTS